ncbi:hypothetical protein QYE76_038717 [Lolium multiflorum]|uniref:Reverse transcriptase domain-containing protein n=1 Tax=Lolium multiflorum TaxID=4521 RepID=A0AAD8WRI0_LOLMU|nr:hypothetical protein QYE76_038717 [Lolium multiflorum]
MEAIAHSDILNKPITPDDAADLEALEAKRQEMLATAQKFARTAAVMLDERKEATHFVENFRQRELEVDEQMVKVRELQQHWKDKVTELQQEADKIRREAIPPRKITFATPTEQQPLATPKDNMKKAAEILKKKDEEIDIDYVRTLVASAMKQQSKADTSRRLESNPDHCMSTAQKDAHDNRHRDDESRTGSSERRRRTREHPNPIPVPSKTPPSDPNKGKDAMYSGKNKYRNPSPPPRGYPRPPPPRRRSPAGNTRPHGPGGINIRDNVAPERNRSRERTPEPRRSRNNDREPEPRRSRNGRPRRSLTEAGTTAAAGTTGKAATEAGVNTAKARGESEGGSKGRPTSSQVQPRSLSDLEKNSIFCWFDLKNAFALQGHLQEACHDKRLAGMYPEEGRNIKKLPHPMAGMQERVDHTAADDDAGGDLAATATPLHQQKKNRDNGISSGSKRKTPPDDQKSGGSEMVAMALQASPEAPPRGKGGKGKNKDKEEDSSEAMDEDEGSPDPKEGTAANSNPFGKKSVGAYHTFLGTPTVRHSKSALRILNATVPAVPQYVGWSETPCTFDRKDHPTVVPKECYALVVSPRIDGYDFSKCLMDGGASLNIMYLETLERMNLTKEQLKHSTEFHGVVPGATYQRTMQRCLKDQIGRNVHAYVDDIAVMTRKGSDLISDLTETFENLRRYKMMLNPLKCVFGVPAGKLLGFIVSNRGIEQSAVCQPAWREGATPVQAIEERTNLWDEAADAALQGLKEILTSPPILAAPGESEPMLLYLAATNRVVSLVIVVERQEEGHELDRSSGYELGAGTRDMGYALRRIQAASRLGAESLDIPYRRRTAYVLQIHFQATNNMAEYEAATRLRIAKEIGIKHIICCGDSDLWHNK